MKYIRTSFNATEEQHEFLKRLPNASKYLRDLLNENMVFISRVPPLQLDAMNKLYDTYAYTTATEENIEYFHNNLLNQGIMVSYSHCAKYLQDKVRHQ